VKDLFDRVVFIVGYGCIGLLPLVQLKLLWRFAPTEVVGQILFIATLSVVTSTLCDGNLSYRAMTSHDGPWTDQLFRIMRLRFARLFLAAPIVVGICWFKGVSLLSAASILLLAGAYLLNYAFAYRNEGSISKALRVDFSSRALCQLCPVGGALILGRETGLLVGSATAFGLQVVQLAGSFGWQVGNPLRDVRAAISRDLFSGMLGILYASFCQTACALLLHPVEFARFISIDRLVRAALMVAEPCRLWYLRQSWMASSGMSLSSVLGAALLVAIVADLSVAFVFVSGLGSFILHTDVPLSFYVGVGFFVALVSFLTLCAFVRHNFVSLMNVLLVIGILAGASAFWLLLSKGTFVAAFAFEAVAATIVVLGSLLTRIPHLRDR
jgi:hypothetical protein